jgi:hypothetical protein
MPVASEARSGEVERGLRAEFFVVLGKRDRSRATRPETSSDLRVEVGARNPPLNGIGVEEAGADAPRIEITFGGESPGDERDEAPEIEDASRVKTMLSFESLLKLNQ